MTDITLKRWFPLVLALGSLSIAQMASAADRNSVRPVGQAVVVDATENRVGSVFSVSGPLTTVLIEAGGLVISLNVAPNQLVGTGGPLYFTTANCTGTAYVPAQPPGLVTASTIAGPGNSLYVDTPNAVPQLITALSTLPPTPRGVPPICLPTAPPPPPPPAPPPPGPPQVFAVAALRLVDLNTAFTGPFSIRTSN